MMLTMTLFGVGGMLYAHEREKRGLFLWIYYFKKLIDKIRNSVSNWEYIAICRNLYFVIIFSINCTETWVFN